MRFKNYLYRKIMGSSEAKIEKNITGHLKRVSFFVSASGFFEDQRSG